MVAYLVASPSIDIEIAWAGGFFEGEGWISIQDKDRSLALGLESTDKDSIDRFCEAVGAGKVVSRNRKNLPEHYKSIYLWRTTNYNDFRTVLALLWPFLGSRRKQRAKEVVSLYENAPYDRRILLI